MRSTKTGTSWKLMGTWSLVTLIGWVLILVPPSWLLSQIPYVLADFPPKALPMAVINCLVTAGTALPGAAILLFLQGRVLRTLLGINPVSWYTRTSRGLVFGWAIGWFLSAIGIMTTRGNGLVGTVIASGALLGMIVGLFVSFNQQGLVTDTDADAVKWILGNSLIWIAGGLLYWAIYHWLDGFAATTVDLGDILLPQPAQDGVYIQRAVLVGWIVVGSIIGVSSSLLLNHITASRQKSL